MYECETWTLTKRPWICETWTLTKRPNLDTNKKTNTEAAEMWFYSRIRRIPWTAHQTNVSVLQEWDKSVNCFVV